MNNKADVERKITLFKTMIGEKKAEAKELKVFIEQQLNAELAELRERIADCEAELANLDKAELTPPSPPFPVLLESYERGVRAGLFQSRNLTSWEPIEEAPYDEYVACAYFDGVEWKWQKDRQFAEVPFSSSNPEYKYFKYVTPPSPPFPVGGVRDGGKGVLAPQG